jgi:uncharacterized membrane protein
MPPELGVPPELERKLPFRDETGGFSLTLKRNCSISPAGLAGVFAALALVVVAIGIGFALAGAWLVLPFAGLEVLLLGGAFVLYARNAADYERIELAAGRLRIEVTDAERVERYDIDARRAKICLEKDEGYGARVLLRASQQEFELGRHLDAAARVTFAAELEKRLRI